MMRKDIIDIDESTAMLMKLLGYELEPEKAQAGYTSDEEDKSWARKATELYVKAQDKKPAPTDEEMQAMMQSEIDKLQKEYLPKFKQYLDQRGQAEQDAFYKSYLEKRFYEQIDQSVHSTQEEIDKRNQREAVEKQFKDNVRDRPGYKGLAYAMMALALAPGAMALAQMIGPQAMANAAQRAVTGIGNYMKKPATGNMVFDYLSSIGKPITNGQLFGTIFGTHGAMMATHPYYYFGNENAKQHRNELFQGLTSGLGYSKDPVGFTSNLANIGLAINDGDYITDVAPTAARIIGQSDVLKKINWDNVADGLGAIDFLTDEYNALIKPLVNDFKISYENWKSKQEQKQK